MPAVCVLADDEVARRRVCAVLRRGRLSVVSHGPTADDLLPASGGKALDAVIVAAGTVDALRQAAVDVRARRPEVRIVGVVEELDWRSVRDLLGAGFDALVLTADIDAALALAVQGALAGQLTLPAILREHLARPLLSAREKQILGMVVMGFSNGEAASKLFISESTVKSHLVTAFAKLGVRSRSEATALILDPQNGLGTGILEISGTAADRAVR